MLSWVDVLQSRRHTLSQLMFIFREEPLHSFGVTHRGMQRNHGRIDSQRSVSGPVAADVSCVSKMLESLCFCRIDMWKCKKRKNKGIRTTALKLC